MRNKPNTTCRVCGKEYFCCSDSRKINSWRTMACSQECFKEYMKRIEQARKPVVEKEISTTVSELKIKEKTSKITKNKVANETIKTEDIIED